MFGGWRDGSPRLQLGMCAMGQETRSTRWVRARLGSYQFIPHPYARPSCPPLLGGRWWAVCSGGSADSTAGDSGVIPGHPPQLLTRRCRAGGGTADLHRTGWGENPGSAAQALIKSKANNKRPE